MFKKEALGHIKLKRREEKMMMMMKPMFTKPCCVLLAKVINFLLLTWDMKMRSVGSSSS